MDKNKNLLKMIFLAMMVAIGVVISPILRVEGMCPMAHFINVTCAVFLGPWYAFICALAIGIIRMIFMGIPPLALTGAVFGAFLSGMLYRLSKGKLVCAFLGEVIGTGIIGAIVSYPVMTLLWGRTGLTWFFYVPSFIAGTLIGGSIAFIFLKQLANAKLLSRFQTALGSDIYETSDRVANDALGIAFCGFIAYLAVVVVVNNFVTQPGVVVNSIKYVVLATGAKPVMAEHPLEVAHITSMASVLAVNLGNITDARMESIMISGRQAEELNIPSIIDSVGVTCSDIRLKLAKEYIDMCRPAVIKGNISEIKVLCGEKSDAAGIDVSSKDVFSEDNQDKMMVTAGIVKELSIRTGAVVVASGKIDTISDGTDVYFIKNGCEMMSRITGTGCMLNVLIASYLSAAADDKKLKGLSNLQAAIYATAMFGIAGERAARKTDRSLSGLGSFHMYLMDEISLIDADIIEKEGRIYKL